MLFCPAMRDFLNDVVRVACNVMKRLQLANWLAPLAIRLYLVPVF